MAKKLSDSVLKALTAAGVDTPSEPMVKSAKTAVKKPARKSIQPKATDADAQTGEADDADDDTEGEQIARYAADLVLTKKGYDVVVMDLRGVADMTDFFVLCSADSDTQVRAIADAVVTGLKDAGEAPYHSEGYGDLSWVLLDYVNVVVHIFLKDKRAFYGIETLWGDAKLISVSDEPAAAAPTKAKVVKSKTAKAVKPKSTTRKTAAPAAKRRTAARKA